VTYLDSVFVYQDKTWSGSADRWLTGEQQLRRTLGRPFPSSPRLVGLSVGEFWCVCAVQRVLTSYEAAGPDCNSWCVGYLGWLARVTPSAHLTRVIHAPSTLSGVWLPRTARTGVRSGSSSNEFRKGESGTLSSNQLTTSPPPTSGLERTWMKRARDGSAISHDSPISSDASMDYSPKTNKVVYTAHTLPEELKK
jgi:hypothetical protein